MSVELTNVRVCVRAHTHKGNSDKSLGASDVGSSGSAIRPSFSPTRTCANTK